ncbi:MFS transporter [Yinghuangia sp. ASG 101]|uniref:MFS transporter n=1 Tax=Yinghuangia sp. ASG 101 TaxID=2896848 RepID=UPI001E6527A3|nr:MFS transporter [Yinghuangia sp. ASG 101]UGQ14656.1 MFS transporter [Yinghuangia sp. ASG 101]
MPAHAHPARETAANKATDPTAPEATPATTPGPPPHRPGSPPPRPGVLLALACLVIFVVILDATIVSVALPGIRDGLDMGATSLPWVVNAYTLAFAGFLLLGGRCCDVFGRRRTFFAGLVLFTAASAACGAAAGAATLVVARVAQGLGGALLTPTTLAIITHTYPEGPRRARALALWSAVGAVGASAGTVLGGVLTEWLDWRWVFLINLPVGAVAFAVAARNLRDHPAARSAPRPRLDVPGAVLATTGLAALLYGLMESSAYVWSAPRVWLPLVGGAVLLAVFAVHQVRWASQPLVPLAVVRARSVASANLVMFLMGLGFFASPVLLSLYLQVARDWSPLRAGMAFLPISVALMVGGLAAGRLIGRWGPRTVAGIGSGLGAVGFGWLALALDAEAGYAESIGLPGIVFGLGIGMCFTPLTVGATSGVAPELAGLASGVINTTRQVSGAVGLAVLTTVTASAGSAYADDHPAAPAAAPLAHGNAVAFACAAAAAALASAGAWLFMKSPGRPRAD